jgi:hypothetical protein
MTSDLPVPDNRAYQQWTQELVEEFVEYLFHRLGRGDQLAFDAEKREIVHKLNDDMTTVNGIRVSSISVRFAIAPLVTITWPWPEQSDG